VSCRASRASKSNIWILKSGKCCPKACCVLRTASVGLGFLRKGNYILVLTLEPHRRLEEFSGNLINKTHAHRKLKDCSLYIVSALEQRCFSPVVLFLNHQLIQQVIYWYQRGVRQWAGEWLCKDQQFGSPGSHNVLGEGNLFLQYTIIFWVSIWHKVQLLVLGIQQYLFEQLILYQEWFGGRHFTTKKIYKKTTYIV
jgi:hypothetical protein